MNWTRFSSSALKPHFWLAAVRQMDLKWEKNIPAANLLDNIINSVVRVFTRLNAGFYETVTFALTTPLNRQPILEPEFALRRMGAHVIQCLEMKPCRSNSRTIIGDTYEN